jgi:hypothetical protein
MKTIKSIKAYSSKLGYELSIDECIDIIDTSYPWESIENAVEDWLNAYETCRIFNEEDVDA